MAETICIELFAPDGVRVWSNSEAAEAACALLGDQPCASVLRQLLGVGGGRKCSRGKVLSQAEALQFVSRDGCSKGFLSVLPAGILLEECVEAFNFHFLRSLNAVQMEFPLVFDSGSQQNCDLIESFEKQGKLFALGGKDSALRLAYASDPGLFGWLSGKQLREDRLPCAIYSPLPVLRRFRSGEVGGLDRPRQYRVHDLHLLVRLDTLFEEFRACMSMLAEGTRFWFDDAFVHYIESDREFIQRFPKFGSEAAKATGQFTMVRVLDERKRYYCVKSGMMIDAGSGAAMLFNLQWDELNPVRFNFRMKQGGDVGVIHCALAGGWSRLLPTFIGRGLAGTSSRKIPWELSSTQVLIIPVSDPANPTAAALSNELNMKGFRSMVSDQRGSVSKKLRHNRDTWQEYYCVVGASEAAGRAPIIESTCSDVCYGVDEFTTQFAERATRCRPLRPLVGLKLPY